MFTMVKLGKNYVVDGKCVQYIPKKTMSLFEEGYMLDMIKKVILQNMLSLLLELIWKDPRGAKKVL